MFLDLLRDTVPPACPGSSWGALPKGHALNTSPGRSPGGILISFGQYPKLVTIGEGRNAD